MKLNLWPKHNNYTQNRAYLSATRNTPLSPYSGALELQFVPSSFYTFVALALMVLYQLESLNLDDYNLTYSKTKTRVLKKIYSNSFETSSFPLYKNSSTTIQTTIHHEILPNTTPKRIKTFQNTFILHFGFY